MASEERARARSPPRPFRDPDKSATQYRNAPSRSPSPRASKTPRFVEPQHTRSRSASPHAQEAAGNSSPSPPSPRQQAANASAAGALFGSLADTPRSPTAEVRAAPRGDDRSRSASPIRPSRGASPQRRDEALATSTSLSISRSPPAARALETEEAEEQSASRIQFSGAPTSQRPPRRSARNKAKTASTLRPAQALAAGLALVNAGNVDALPKVGGAPRHPNEIALPADGSYSFPAFSHFAFYEESGAFREAFAALGYAACSVSERPTTRAPSAHCVHYIGTVQQFVEQYPHPLGLVVTHVTCTALTGANRAQWSRCFQDGSMQASAMEFVWASSLGAFNASENPPGVLTHLVGPPTLHTNAHEHGCPMSKQWCWWLRGLPTVPPSKVVPAQQRVDALSGLRNVHADARMLLRSATPPSLARSHAEAWDAVAFVAKIFTPLSPASPPDNAVTVDCRDGTPLHRFEASDDDVVDAHTALASGRPVNILCDGCSSPTCACRALSAYMRSASIAAHPIDLTKHN